MICYLFVPIHWLFFAASTYVWVQYVWHTGMSHVMSQRHEKCVCGKVVSSCLPDQAIQASKLCWVSQLKLYICSCICNEFSQIELKVARIGVLRY